MNTKQIAVLILGAALGLAALPGASAEPVPANSIAGADQFAADLLELDAVATNSVAPDVAVLTLLAVREGENAAAMSQQVALTVKNARPRRRPRAA